MYLFFIVMLCVCAANFSQANVGIPVLLMIEPWLVVSLLFVIGIEAFIMKKEVKLPFKKALFATTISNLISSLIGVPLAWGILFLFQFLLLFLGSKTASLLQLFSFDEWNFSYKVSLLAPAWIQPLDRWGWEEKIIFGWSFIYVLILFYITSAWIESHINHRYLKSIEYPIIKKATWKANAYSYLFLAMILLISIPLESQWGILNKLSRFIIEYLIFHRS